jgi:hypothetical protein
MILVTNMDGSDPLNIFKASREAEMLSAGFFVFGIIDSELLIKPIIEAKICLIKNLV